MLRSRFAPALIAVASFLCAMSSVAQADSCQSVGACALYTNGSTGSGLLATSTGGDGLVGISTAAQSAQGHRFVAGVHGISSTTATTWLTTGVFGESNAPYGIGVVGRAYEGVFGLGEWIGTVGLAKGVPVQGYPHLHAGYGVIGAGPSGVEGFGRESDHAGTIGIDFSTTGTETTGVFGYSTFNGVFGEGGAFGVLARAIINPTAVALQMEGGGGLLMRGVSSYPGRSVMSLDNSGNLVLAGTLVQQGSPLSRIGSTSQNAPLAFSERSARAIIEDVGEATLSHGTAFVPLAGDFAHVIRGASSYVVFVTPEGDAAHQLFVRSRTTSGFTVAETQHGADSVRFAYRVVATPSDADGSRFPSAASAPHLDAAPIARHNFVPDPMPTFAL